MLRQSPFIIKDILQRMNLRRTSAKVQCYDGCSTMSGAIKVLPQTLNQMSQEPSSHTSMATVGPIHLAAVTIRTSKRMRADDKFAIFCKYVTTLGEHNLVNAPVLPRRRCLPARYEDENEPAEFYETPESRYRHV